MMFGSYFPKVRRALLMAAILFLGAAGLAAQDNNAALEELAGRIAEKRSEVESLSNQLDLLKAEYNEKLRSIGTQQADVETQIKRQELQLAQVEEDIDDFLNRIEDTRTSLNELEPIVLEVIQNTREYISGALPFQVDGRLQELDTLERLLNEGKLDEGSTLARLWNTLESEFRLTSESGIYRQTIDVAGEQQLAEVARLGMTMMFFKTFDERYGYVVPGSNGWEYRYASGREEANQIAGLFDSLRRNLREGFFVLPNPRAEG